MIIVADSGSTKADWMVIGQAEQHLVKTMGFNPVFHDSDLIYKELAKAFTDKALVQGVSNVYYYGAGCWDARRKEVVAVALRRLFAHAEISVEHDLLGAARATCGTDPGISCILGTGSNSCLYDGVDVTDNVTNLGYLLGDEGSGTFLGKMLIRAYFYREMPKALVPAFEEFVGGGKDVILDKIYGKETPNVYLARFTKFMAEHQAHPFMQHLLYEGMSTFIDHHVRKYKGHKSLPIHFIGSIAFVFRDVIQAVLEARDLNMGSVIKKPIDSMVLFHTGAVLATAPAE